MSPVFECDVYIMLYYCWLAVCSVFVDCSELIYRGVTFVSFVAMPTATQWTHTQWSSLWAKPSPCVIAGSRNSCQHHLHSLLHFIHLTTPPALIMTPSTHLLTTPFLILTPPPLLPPSAHQDGVQVTRWPFPSRRPCNNLTSRRNVYRLYSATWSYGQVLLYLESEVLGNTALLGLNLTNFLLQICSQVPRLLPAFQHCTRKTREPSKLTMWVT